MSSFSRAVVARARSAHDLDGLLEGRIFRGAGYVGVQSPYAVFELAETPELTMGPGADLTRARVSLRLFTRTASLLDELELAARAAFDKFSGDAGNGLVFASWVESARDEAVDPFITDSAARLYSRVLSLVVAMNPA